MMTFKQLEAIYWVVRLGGFAKAAEKLHTTQSAVSKRIQELEALFDTPLFDRTLRTSRLTEKGEEMVAVAKRLLEQRDLAVEQFQKPEIVERQFRLGITELTAMTWLPKLVARIQAFYPKVTIRPAVETGLALRDKLLADELDLAIVPDAFKEPRFAAHPVGTVEVVWMCKPGFVETRRPLRLHELSRYPLLLQTQSATNMVLDRWLESQGVRLTSSISSNNMLAQIGMTVSGLGITYLPLQCLKPMIESGMLTTIKVTPSAPEMSYVAMYRSEQRSTLVKSIAMLAQECCDFSSMFQTEEAVNRGR